MNDRHPGIADYPLAEKQPDRVRTASGKTLDDLTLDAVVAGDMTMEDLRITRQALLDQAAIARAAGRATLAANFERASELVDVPQHYLLSVYELLRPGRAKEKATLLGAADVLRRQYGAERLAAFVEEAAEVYERRRLFSPRY